MFWVYWVKYILQLLKSILPISVHFLKKQLLENLKLHMAHTTFLLDNATLNICIRSIRKTCLNINATPYLFNQIIWVVGLLTKKVFYNKSDKASDRK